MASKKQVEDEGLYIIERVGSGIKSKRGSLMNPRSYRVTTTEEGDERLEDLGNYEGVKFASSKEDLVPQFDLLTKKWGFAGDEAELQRIVNEVDLRYPKGHPDFGQPIKKANINDMNDPFFDHPTWRNNSTIMDGNNTVLKASDPKQRFLALCYMGSRDGYNAEENDGRYVMGKKYKVSKSSSSDKQYISNANQELELTGSLNNMTIETAKLISIIMGLVYTDKTVISPDIVKPNLLTAIKKTAKNPGDSKIFEGKSYQTMYLELSKDGLDILNKKANIRMALNTNIIRYKDGSYQMKGKELGKCETFSQLVNYFASKENVDDYTKLLDSLRA